MEKKTNPIDRIIKEKLEGLHVPFDAESWQQMEQKLDGKAMGMESKGQPVADTRHIDEAFFEKLHRYSAPYQPSHWRRMEALLEEAFAWPREVLRYKLTELSLMLLLLLLLWQYIPTMPGASATAPVAPGNQESPLPATPAEREAIPAGTAPQAFRSGAEDSPATDNRSAALPSAPGSADAGSGTVNEMERHAQGGMAAAHGGPAQIDGSRREGPTAFSSLQPAKQRSSFLGLPPRPLPNSVKETAFTPAHLESVARLDNRMSELEYEGAGGIEEMAIKKNKNAAVFRVGMFGSAEYNHITVPSSEEKKLEEELQRYAIGYGGGLSLGFEKGRFEIETGAIYAAREYPVGLVYVNGSVGGGLQGQRLEASELNIINVPLHFRYSFLRQGSWRAYALAGASLQVAFQRNYYVSEEPQFSFLPMQPPSSPPPASQDEPFIDRIRRSGLGWFEGGTFEENAYLTGNLGLGIERYVNSRWSLFLQPTYQHSLQYFRVGLGPNADQINSLSVLFGAKVRLK